MLTVSAVGIVLGCVFFAVLLACMWLSVDGLILFRFAVGIYRWQPFNLLYNYAEKLIEK